MHLDRTTFLKMEQASLPKKIEQPAGGILHGSSGSTDESFVYHIKTSIVIRWANGLYICFRTGNKNGSDLKMLDERE